MLSGRSDRLWRIELALGNWSCGSCGGGCCSRNDCDADSMCEVSTDRVCSCCMNMACTISRSGMRSFCTACPHASCDSFWQFSDRHTCDRSSWDVLGCAYVTTNTECSIRVFQTKSSRTPELEHTFRFTLFWNGVITCLSIFILFHSNVRNCVL